MVQQCFVYCLQDQRQIMDQQRQLGAGLLLNNHCLCKLTQSLVIGYEHVDPGAAAFVPKFPQLLEIGHGASLSSV